MQSNAYFLRANFPQGNQSILHQNLYNNAIIIDLENVSLSDALISIFCAHKFTIGCHHKFQNSGQKMTQQIA